jgi:hypothetical protein
MKTFLEAGLFQPEDPDTGRRAFPNKGVRPPDGQAEQHPGHRIHAGGVPELDGSIGPGKKAARLHFCSDRPGQVGQAARNLTSSFQEQGRAADDLRPGGFPHDKLPQAGQEPDAEAILSN